MSAVKKKVCAKKTKNDFFLSPINNLIITRAWSDSLTNSEKIQVFNEHFYVH